MLICQYHGLIDRDFLGAEEITEIGRRQANLHVLRYYALQSYLYHPENIAELDPTGYDESAYRTALKNQMATVRDRLLVNLHSSRRSYEIIQELSKELKRQAIQEQGNRLNISGRVTGRR